MRFIEVAGLIVSWFLPNFVRSHTSNVYEKKKKGASVCVLRQADQSCFEQHEKIEESDSSAKKADQDSAPLKVHNRCWSPSARQARIEF